MLTVVDEHLLRPEILHVVEIDGAEGVRDCQVEEAVMSRRKRRGEEEREDQHEKADPLGRLGSALILFERDSHVHRLLRNRPIANFDLGVGSHTGGLTGRGKGEEYEVSFEPVERETGRNGVDALHPSGLAVVVPLNISIESWRVLEAKRATE